jgi:hemerythrin superfamily protein
MDAIELLENDHKNTRNILEAIANSVDARRAAFFKTFRRELELHNRIEESIFYPSVQTGSAITGSASRGKDAHKLVEAALAYLDKLPIDDPHWEPTFRVVQDRLLKHFAEEETGIFVRVRELLSISELSEIGIRMLNQKERQLRMA